MAMKMLAAGGVGLVTDGERTADSDNPKGYFEDERVKDLGQMSDKAWVRASRGKAIKVISYLLKDLPPDNFYQVIFMRRALEEVCASQNKMLDRRGEDNESSDDKMIDLYKDHLWRVNWMFRTQKNYARLEIPYRETVQDPQTQAERMREFLGMDLDVEKMVGVVDPSLYRNRA